MPTLYISTNPLELQTVVIPDIGVEIPGGNQPQAFSELDVLMEFTQSADLVDLATDDAFGAGSSTLIINDGVQNIPQNSVASFLLTAYIPGTGPYGAVKRDAQGIAPTGITASEHEDLDTLTHNLAQDLYSEVEYDPYFRITASRCWQTPAKVLLVREQVASYIGLSRRLNNLTVIQYDPQGVESSRVETTYTYTGLRLISSTSTKT